MPETTAEAKASSDAYDLIRFEQLKVETAKIRSNPKRFTAAINYIKKENEERRKAMQKENVARASAVKK